MTSSKFNFHKSFHNTADTLDLNFKSDTIIVEVLQKQQKYKYTLKSPTLYLIIIVFAQNEMT
jgi:hypothetical protein